MWIFLLLVAGVFAEEICYTDAPNLEDPTYTDPQLVSLELNMGGLYRFYPDSFDRLAIGSGVNLDSDRVIQIYEFTKEDSMATLTSHQMSESVEVPLLDLTQSFEFYTDGPIQLFQNKKLIAEFISFLRIPFHIGWRHGTLCYTYETLEESEEPNPPQNYITPLDEL